MITKPLYIYDIETYFNVFLFSGKFAQSPEVQTFEISFRRNDKQALLNFLSYLKNIDAHMVGYNNLDFDYPVIHDLMNNGMLFNERYAYDLAQKIIDSQKFGGLSNYKVNLNNRHIHQIDLLRIWHFDNDAKRTRLKDLEFAMRSQNVADLPYDFRKPLESHQIDELRTYNVHDLTETEKFLNFTMERLKLRFDLLNNKIIRGDILNYNDTKIGEMFFVEKLGRNNCYNGKKPKGTDRGVVDFHEVILPKIQFRLESFADVLETFKTKRWIKGDKDHNGEISFERDLGGIKFKFGSGGVHASVDNKVYRSSETHKIIDIDVSGMYPAVGITNRFYPEHLGEPFVNVYRQLQIDRKQYKKGTPMNAVLKLAQNGVYGKSNSEYSPFFDVKYLFKITINGQLQLTQLAEMITTIPGVELIQCNTDGITLYLPRNLEWFFDTIKKDWEKMTGLELEQVEYKSMYIADVNNYIAEKMDGSVKRKGRYWFPLSWADYDEGAGQWHTDQSQLIVPKVADAVMRTGQHPLALLKESQDPFDFMIRQKVKGQQRGYVGDQQTQRTVRYYVSKAGQPMKIIHPPSGPAGDYKRKAKVKDSLFDQVIREIGPGVWDARIHTGNKSKYEERETSIVSGFKVKQCNNASDFNWNDVDYDYYLAEVEKVIIKG
jgi:hypothetical protein